MASNSEVDVCNLALSLIGEQTIVSITAPTNKRERLCKILYGQAVRLVLSSFDWPFARGFKKLNELEDVDLPPGMYGFKLPTDCAAPKDVYPRGRDIWWEWSGDMILLKSGGDQYLYYTTYQNNPTKFSDMFTTSVAELLASWLAQPLTGDKKLASDKFTMWSQNLQTYMATEANAGTEYRRQDENPDFDTFINPDYNRAIDSLNYREE